MERQRRSSEGLDVTIGHAVNRRGVSGDGLQNIFWGEVLKGWEDRTRRFHCDLRWTLSVNA